MNKITLFKLLLTLVLISNFFNTIVGGGPFDNSGAGAAWVFTNKTTAVQDLTQDIDVSVFPNPVSNLVQIHFKNTQQIFEPTDEILVTNASGATIAHQKLNNLQSEINSESWATGIYFLFARLGDKQVRIAKIVKSY